MALVPDGTLCLLGYITPGQCASCCQHDSATNTSSAGSSGAVKHCMAKIEH